jgi:hypothetical protein
MLRIDTDKKTLIALERKTMREAGYWERRDIQEMICRTPGVFCEELGEKIHILGSEVQPSDVVQDRIDLLGIDPDGAGVIIEIKRDSHKLQLLQALSYAGMIAKWEPKRFIERLIEFNRKQQTYEQAKAELEEFLGDGDGDIETINRDQRIVLLAEAFDYEVLVTADWLSERYDVDIRCYRIGLAKNDNDHFLTCTRAYPPPELTELAIDRRRKNKVGPETRNWDEALGSIENQAVVDFFKVELKRGLPNNSKYKSIRFSVTDRLRFLMYAKKSWARVWQSARFDNDIDFWTSRFGERCSPKPISDGLSLRFTLTDKSDFEKFKKALTTELSGMAFYGGADEGDDAEGKGGQGNAG